MPEPTNKHKIGCIRHPFADTAERAEVWSYEEELYKKEIAHSLVELRELAWNTA